MSLLSVYFDESYGTGDHFTLAGYSFKQSSLKPFEKKWQRMLDRFELSFFRMSSCAHGNGEFKHLNRSQRIECQKAAFRLIHQHACDGYAVSFRLGLLKSPSFEADFYGMDDYTWSCWAAMAFVRYWMKKHNWPGKARYFFEAGHQTQSQAAALMDCIANDDELIAAYRYDAHAFIKKQDSGAVQAADILAWQAQKDLKRRTAGHSSRKDFIALLERKHTNVVFADGRDHVFDYLKRMFEGDRRTLRDLLLDLPPAIGVRGPAHGEHLRQHL